jgi:putative phage-type endonuclease
MEKPYEVIDLVQGSPEWLKYREKHVGASDVPSIMGCGYDSAYKVWLEKLGFGEKKYETAAMQKGKEFESIARTDFICQTGLVGIKPMVLHSLREDHLMASMDGADLEKDIALEIKIPTMTSGFHEMAMDGVVPEKFIPQLQTQMFVMGIAMIYYFSWHECSSKIIEVPYNEEYVKDLIQKTKEFQECVNTLNPPPLTNKDYIERNDSAWTSNALKLREIQEKRKALEAEEDMLKETLVGLSGGRNCKGGNITVTKIVSKGRIDYKAAVEKNNIDAEPFRNSSTSHWRVA